MDAYLLETSELSTVSKNRKVFGVGINDWKYRSYFNGKPVWQYSLWSRIMERSFCEKYKQRFPHYKDVTCDPLMEIFQYLSI